MITNVEYLGNKDLLQLKKIAFLASNTISSGTVLKVYDWATDMRNRGECVVSGFCSKLEKDVLHFLLKGSQPIILVLARKMYKTVPLILQRALNENRLLIVSVSVSVRQSKTTALERNKYICDMAEKILFVGVTEQSRLYTLQQNNSNKQKLLFL